MITGWILDLIAAAWSGLLDAIPVPSEDSWLSDVGGAVAWLGNTLDGLGAWLPFGLIGSILVTLVSIWGTAVAIRLGRMALSLFTGGGGA